MKRRVIAGMAVFYFLLLLSPLAVSLFFSGRITQGTLFGIEHVLWGLVLLAGLIVGCTLVIIREIRELKSALTEKAEDDEKQA